MGELSVDDPSSQIKNRANPQDENEEAVSLSLNEELRAFIAHITSLAVTLPVATNAVKEVFTKKEQEFLDFMNKNIDQVEQIEGKTEKIVRMRIVEADYTKYTKLMKDSKTYRLALKTLPRSYIMSLISQFDAFLGGLVRIILMTRPEILNISERNLTFSQLVELQSVEHAKNFLMDKEIESFLRKSHAEQFEWMEAKFNLPLRKDLEIWPDFIEVTERRNLFVHTSGIVSSQYLKVCKEHNVLLKDIKTGQELHVDYKYFEHAYQVVFEIGFKLAQVLWRKFRPDELEKADTNLIEIGYEALQEENYQLTKIIFDFATQILKKYSSAEDRYMMIVNRALAYKWSGDAQKAKQMISQEDWSATSAKFKLAREVILDNYNDAYEIMHTLGNDKGFLREYYRMWPLFKVIKDEPKFQEVFEEIYGEPYNRVELSSISLPDKLSPKD